MWFFLLPGPILCWKNHSKPHTSYYRLCTRTEDIQLLKLFYILIQYYKGMCTIYYLKIIPLKIHSKESSIMCEECMKNVWGVYEVCCSWSILILVILVECWLAQRQQLCFSFHWSNGWGEGKLILKQYMWIPILGHKEFWKQIYL